MSQSSALLILDEFAFQVEGELVRTELQKTAEKVDRAKVVINDLNRKYSESVKALSKEREMRMELEAARGDADNKVGRAQLQHSR